MNLPFELERAICEDHYNQGSRHIILTCKHHPDLRWTCKPQAYTPGKGYNGARSIFYQNWPEPECSCPASDLIMVVTETEN